MLSVSLSFSILPVLLFIYQYALVLLGWACHARHKADDLHACYRIITSIASHIDLNTLDALAITCRQIRANLLQFRTQLLTSTLHCANEDAELNTDNTLRYRARAADWYFLEAGRDHGGTGKVGNCARDMVGECRRCGTIVCRVRAPDPLHLCYT